MRYNIHHVLSLTVLLLLFGCADLSVDNPNAPDRDRAITDPGDLKSVLDGGYSSFWEGTYEGTPQTVPQPHFDAWADAMTTTNAFQGFWSVAADEPRVQYNNTVSFAHREIGENPWQNLNAAISSSNDVIRQIELEDFDVIVDGDDDTQMVLAAAYFLRGLAFGHLANFFDQAFIPTHEIPEEELIDLELSPHQDVLDQATSDLEEARSIARDHTFTFDQFLPWSQTVNNDRLIRLANSFEARFKVSNPRTPSENDAVNWSDVLNLTQNGIQGDVVMNLDGSTWFNNYQYISGLYWYWRVDNRIINMMDSDYPVKYPTGAAGGPIAPADSDDHRLCPTSGDSDVFDDVEFFQGDGIAVARELDCYFVYDTDQSFFSIERGPALQSNYWFGRDFADQQWNQTPFAAGPGPIFLEEENRLMQAEAEIRANNNTGAAADLVNAGSRVNIGELPPLESDASDEEVLDAIYYERDIELYRTGMGLPFFDMRRLGRMQIGTPLHLPVPASELRTIQQPIYTFGGVGNAGEPGTASGDNAWCDEGEWSCDPQADDPRGDVAMPSIVLDFEGRSYQSSTGRTMPKN